MPIYDLQALGVVNDGNPANAAKNTAIFLDTEQKARGGNPGPMYLGMGGGMAVLNGKLGLNGSNMVLRGDGGMGAVSDWGPTSLIRGFGPGDTLNVNQGGCRVEGLAWQGDSQGGSDAFLRVNQTQCMIHDLWMDSPNIGISLQFPKNALGEFWIRDILVQGKIKVAGIVANAGDATVHISHVIMFSDPQSPYGICVTSCGELNVNDGCDIINCGSCLAIVPGLNGVMDQHVVAVSAVGSYFDSGNGQGCVFIQPTNRAYVLKASFTDCWASTGKNLTNTNGFTIDGSLSKPALPNLKSLQNVKLIGCTSKSFRIGNLGHCGLYARGVDALTVQGSTFGDCFNGIQLAAGCTNFLLQGNSCGDFVPPSLPFISGGNVAWGILLEAGLGKGIVTGNVLTGNGAGGLFNQQPNPGQVIGQNVQ